MTPSPHHWKRDLAAAVNVAILGLPQGIAYAMIAGLPVHYGVLGSAFASMVGSFFISSPFVVPGPSNSTAFLIFSAFAAAPELPKLALMPLVLFVTGVILCLAAAFRLSDLVRFISRSVLVGYISGAALLIIANQLLSFTGIPAALNQPHGPANFFTILAATMMHLKAINLHEIAMGAGTLAFYLLLRALRPKWPVFIITLASCTAITYTLNQHFQLSLHTIKVDASAFTLGAFQPKFQPGDWWRSLGHFDGVLGICSGMALLCLIETSVMSRNLASRHGLTPNIGRDITAVGVANIFCSLFSPMPASGSMTRSVLNEQSGARTKWAGFFSGAFTLPLAFLCAGGLHWIPRAGLSALVILIALSLLKPKEIRVCFKATKEDAITLLSSFFAALALPLHIAVFVGVGISIILFLRTSSRPEMVEYDFSDEGSLRELSGNRENPGIAIVHVEGSLFFGAADMFRNQLMTFCRDPNLRILILRMKNAHHLDATGVLALEELIHRLKESDRTVLVSGVMKEIYRVLSRSGLRDRIGRDNIFLGSPSNPNLATKNALIRAQRILGTKEADVRIFVRAKEKNPA